MGETNLIKPLHGLRGLAALTVVIGHIYWRETAPSLGVVLFFVLSGFLLGKLYLGRSFDQDQVWDYTVARLARVYPLFAFVIVGTVIFNMTLTADVFELGAGDVFAHLVLVGSNKTVWTISTEMQFYAVFIGLWALCSRATNSLLPILSVFSVSMMVMIYLGLSAGRISILGYLHIFTAGVLISILLDKPSRAMEKAARYLLPVSIGIYVLIFFIAQNLYQARVIYMDMTVVSACGVLVWAAVAGEHSLTGRALSQPFLVWLGEISFGIYLLHRHAFWMVDAYIPISSDWLSTISKLALTILLAWLANIWIEHPCRKGLRSIAKKKPGSRDAGLA